tara:strand:+ start:620 stop:1009 length:390 start_codon:yes stop_codon:yes gene_type:complete
MKQNIGLFKTLVICLYDWMLLFSILFFLSFPMVFLNQGDNLGNNIFYQLYVFFIIIFYYSWFWKKHKQTLGMKSWRVYIENTSGIGEISIKQCILRIFFSLIGGHILLIFNDKSLHDLISRTRIVKKDD